MDPDTRTRLRDFGREIGADPVGETNTIVDVAGVRVGHVTVSDGSTIFSGATAVVVDGAAPDSPIRAGIFVGNGYGKLIGLSQVQELGLVETPIVLTSTLSVFRAADAIVTWMLREHGDRVTSVNPVAGEINDAWLSDGVRRPITAEHVIEAIDTARSDAVEMGAVGGGAGSCALGFKGGIGSSSRLLTIATGELTIGALVQINMDGLLRLDGRTVSPTDLGLRAAGPETADGSCMIVIAVDGALDAGLLRRVAARAVYALARTGARFSHGSGDYAIAISSAVGRPPIDLSTHDVSHLFEATMDAVEEAVIDALLAAKTVVTATGRTAAALPHSVLAT